MSSSSQLDTIIETIVTLIYMANSPLDLKAVTISNPIILGHTSAGAMNAIVRD